MTALPYTQAPLFTFGIGAAAFHAAPQTTVAAAELLGCVLPHAIDAATLTASSEAGELTVDNLQNIDPTAVWRSDSTVESIDIELDGDEECNCAMFVMPNFSGSHRMEFLGAGSLLGLDDPVYESGLINPYPNGYPWMEDFDKKLVLVRFDNTSRLPFWRINHYEGGTPTYIQYARLMMCKFVQFSRGPSKDGTELGYASADIQTATEYGGTFADPRLTPRTAVVNFPAKSAADTSVAMEMHRRLGKAKDFGLFINPGAAGTEFQIKSIHGLFSQDGSYKPVPILGLDGKFRWATSFSVRELRS